MSLGKNSNIIPGSKEWYDCRQEEFNSSECASLLGIGYVSPEELVLSKINRTPLVLKDQETLALAERGTRLEPFVRAEFERRHGITAPSEFRRHQDPSYPLRATPDGVCLCKETGRIKFLVEYKVRGMISYQVPEKYWVQMQCQMEVFDTDQCIYVDNVVHEPGFEPESRTGSPVLTKYHEIVVNRDKQWFNTVMLPALLEAWRQVESGRKEKSTGTTGSTSNNSTAVPKETTRRKRKYGESEPEPETISVQSKKTKYLEDELSVTQFYLLKNYLRRDPILDWFSFYGDATKKDQTVNPFLAMMGRKNNEFAERVIRYLTDLHGKKYEIVNIDPAVLPPLSQIEPHSRKVTLGKLEATSKAMAQETPIIFNAYLRGTYNGIAIGDRVDMLVHRSCLQDIFGKDCTAAAATSTTTSTPTLNYTVVLFRYATINLRADGCHLLNNAKQSVYKAQAHFLNLLLNGTGTGKEKSWMSFIIGRKYDYTSKGTKHKITNAFGHIGRIVYEQEVFDTLNKAMEWHLRVKSPEAASWDLLDPQMPEMYPNMKNNNDFPWHGEKLRVAKAINEITLMYRCGPAVRERAMAAGITSYTELQPEHISKTRGVTAEHVAKFLQTKGTQLSRDDLQLLTLNRVPLVEFFLDFEAVGNMYDDFKTFPEAGDYAMIFLAGLVYKNNVTGECKYRHYTITSLDHDEERRIIGDLLEDIRVYRTNMGQNFAPVYYWSADAAMMQRVLGQDYEKEHSLLMIDLCQAFRESQVTMEGQSGYSLGDIAGLMYKAGYIKTTWSDTNAMSNGLQAMIDAINYYNYDCQGTDFFAPVIEYNYTDCKVMEEMLSYFRHIQ